jgi:hypothetical protein
MRILFKISPKASVFILLFSFLGIYMINIGCSIDNIVDELDWFSQTEQKHNHGSHAHNDGHHHNHGNKETQDKEDDGCCNDEASAFFASVQAVPVHQVKHNFSPTEFSILDVTVTEIFDFDFFIKYFVDTRPPPDILPRFPNTRIFIQSFQI